MYQCEIWQPRESNRGERIIADTKTREIELEQSNATRKFTATIRAGVLNNLAKTIHLFCRNIFEDLGKIAKTLRKWNQYLLAEPDSDLFWPVTMFTLQAVLCIHADAAFSFLSHIFQEFTLAFELSSLNLAVETAISNRRSHSYECWKSC